MNIRVFVRAATWTTGYEWLELGEDTTPHLSAAWPHPGCQELVEIFNLDTKSPTVVLAVDGPTLLLMIAGLPSRRRALQATAVHNSILVLGGHTDEPTIRSTAANVLSDQDRFAAQLDECISDAGDQRFDVDLVRCRHLATSPTTPADKTLPARPADANTTAHRAELAAELRTHQLPRMPRTLGITPAVVVTGYVTPEPLKAAGALRVLVAPSMLHSDAEPAPPSNAARRFRR